MRIIFLMIVLCSFRPFHSNAQPLEKGNFTIGLSNVGALWSRVQSSGTSYSSFSIQPSGGYFFANQFLVGSNLGLQVGKSNSTQLSTFGLTPFVRYYLEDKDNDLIFIQPFSGWSRSRSASGTYSTISSSTNLGLAIGYTHLFYQQIGLEALVGFQQSQGKTNNENITIPTSKEFFIQFGFQWYLQRSME